MKVLLILTQLLALTNAFITSTPIRRFTQEINGNSIKVFEPKNINPKNTHSLLFFTGGNALITSEIYTNFLYKLASQNLSIYIAPNNLDDTEEVFDFIDNNYLDVTNIGHSSGAVNALKCANKNKNLKKTIFLDPVNSDELFNSFNFNPLNLNPLSFFQKEENNPKLFFKYIKDLLVINAKKSYEWKLQPLTIPFIPAFKMKTETMIKDDVNINILEADNFGHSDILNPFWGDLMHNTISKGSDDRNEEIIDKYHEWLSLTIKDFVSNEKPLLSDFDEDVIDEDYENEFM